MSGQTSEQGQFITGHLVCQQTEQPSPATEQTEHVVTELLNEVLGQTKRFLRGCENFLPALA